jgi:hypothetical protein
MLIEMCCRCGFVHKDSRINYRAYKPHYHWTPTQGELTHEGVTLHATICMACLQQQEQQQQEQQQEQEQWKEFYAQKKLTPSKYRVKYSLNAPLPERYIKEADELYAQQVAHFDFE